MEFKIPKEVRDAAAVLTRAGFEAHIVGGSVRDLLRGEEPDDWDIATNAIPEELQKLFPKSFYENNFGTVTVVTKSRKASLQHIEITPYRSEAAYSDRRHPDKIEFTKTLQLDLKRRDFTINAMAFKVEGEEAVSLQNLVDIYGGREDLKNELIRAVGYPVERFQEDALRLMRAVRLTTKLDFDIELKTARAMAANAKLLTRVSAERIRDELSKMVMADTPDRGFEIMRELGILPFVMPELLEGYGVGQNKHHIYTIWEHNLRALKYAAEKKWTFEVRMAALLHDVAKPRTKQGDGPDSTFYGHDVVGAAMAVKILERLKYPRQVIQKVSKLVRFHLFYYNVGEVSESSVRRLIRKIGPEDMDDLIKVRICDRIGSGVPKAEPYKLRHFRFLVEKLSRDPISVKMLRITGNDVMEIVGLEPSPKIGFLLNILLEDVLDDPLRNRKAHLTKRAKELAAMTDAELQALAFEAKKKTVSLEEGEVDGIKKKHWVK